MAADDDDRDVSDAEYAELRRFVPAHARPRPPRRTPQDARIRVIDWLGDIAHAIARKLRRA
jgi:hypothetical protein